MSKPRKTKRERLAIRGNHSAFADYRKELVDRNMSQAPEPKPMALPKREAKFLSGARGDLWNKSPRFRDPWNSPRPTRAGTWHGMQMFFGGGKNIKERKP